MAQLCSKVLIGLWVRLMGTCRLLVYLPGAEDAIDNIITKVELLKYCHEHSIKVFASLLRRMWDGLSCILLLYPDCA
jgi:hypothetical protein